MQKYQDRVFSTAGQPIQGVLITVYLTGTSTLATLYSDNGVTITGNPVSTDVNGYFYFYAPDGRYDIAFSGSAIASPLLLTDVSIEDVAHTLLTSSDPGVFTDTQSQGTITGQAGHSVDWDGDYQTEQGAHNITAGVVGAVLVPNTSTVWGAAGVAGFINSLDATTDAVGGYFQGRATATGAKVWGSNSLVADVNGVTAASLIGNEIDINVRGTPTAVQGLQITGQCTGSLPAGAQAIGVTVLGSTPWTYGFLSGDNAATYAIGVGNAGTGNNIPSQLILLTGKDSGGVKRNASISATADGDVLFVPSSGRTAQSTVFQSLATTGTAPLVVASTTKVSNLTVERLANVVNYNGQATAGIGVSPIFGAADRLAQGANIGATALFTPSSGGFLYKISASAMVTQAATTSSTLPSVVISWTDADNNTAQSFTLCPTNSGNTLTTFQSASMLINAKNAVAINYSTTGYATSGATSMQYALHIRCEAL